MPIYNIIYRYAKPDDLDSICKFVDFWLAGKALLKFLNPKAIRSKTDQSTGNPNEFYKRQEFTQYEKVCIGKHHNIDLLKKPTDN